MKLLIALALAAAPSALAMAPYVPDVDDPILDWWKVKECKWPSLAKMVQAILCGAGLVGRRRARVLCGGQDAWRLAEVG